MKKIISVMLAVIMVAVMFAVPASAYVCPDNNIPFVVIKGDKKVALYNEDGSYTLPTEDDEEEMDNLLSSIGSLIMDALKTGDWDAYGQKIVDILAPIYEDIAPDGNGNLPANTGLDPYDRVDFDAVDSTHYYHMGKEFTYCVDPRLSPVDAVDDLQRYIDIVKEKTGHDKVILIGTCAGADLAMAFLCKKQWKQGFPDIEKLIINAGTMNGLDYSEALLSGSFKADDETAFLFAKSTDLFEDIDAGVMEWIYLLLETLYDSYGLEITAGLVNLLYNAFKDTAIKDYLRLYYARCGSYLATVNDKFDEAMEYLYGSDEDKIEFAGIIEKANEYHYDVQLKTDEMLLDMQKAGKSVNFISQYGFMTYPIGPDAMLPSDTFVSVPDTSYGATVSKINSTLSEDYIAARQAEGLGKYISPDKQIDASTCLFRDTTWFVKNAEHEYCESIRRLILAISRNDNFTVDSSEAFPQFLNFVGSYEDLQPAKELNDNDINWVELSTTDKTAGKTLIQKIVDIFRTFIENIVQQFRDFINGIKNIK